MVIQSEITERIIGIVGNRPTEFAGYRYPLMDREPSIQSQGIGIMSSSLYWRELHLAALPHDVDGANNICPDGGHPKHEFPDKTFYTDLPV